MKLQFLQKSKLTRWLASLAVQSEVYVPAVIEGNIHWQRFDEVRKDDKEGPGLGLERIRASEPIKSFFFSPRERVASLPGRVDPADPGKRVLFGVKNCDLLPLRVHEKMFLEGDFQDTFYEARRRGTLLVAADCPSPADSCFCNLVGRTPYARDGADVVLSTIEDGHLLESLTDEGAELLRLGGDAIQPATEVQAKSREEVRSAAVARLAELNPALLSEDLSDRVKKREGDDSFWKKHATDCVECFACLMTCPTCYCFLLYDRAKELGMERTKTWDACYMAAYARVGGGANPRSEFVRRFANRLQCKFRYFTDTRGFAACSGCGRCFKACMGKIDVRDILAGM